MSKAIVNMTPNPLDIQTIHCSQGDTEAREWGFELHNNGELIDTSDVKEQLFFKAYKGGTEQILPENTSTPTTSPFKGDIRYPQWLLTDQEFTYRQSPTEEDGLAKITDIKGNTLVWNQLVETVYAPSSAFNGITRTALGNGGVRVSGTATATDNYTLAIQIRNVAGHKVLTDVGCELPSGSRIIYSTEDRQRSVIATVPSSGFFTIAIRINANTTIDVNAYPQVFDLTQMFGATKAEEIYAMEQAQSGNGVAYFRSFFPLSYYSYNQGSLLSFNGNGIKTVGFNKWDEEWEAGILNINGSSSYSDNRIITSYVPILPNTTYSVTIPFNGKGRGAFYDADKNLIEYFYDFPASGRSDVFPRDGLIKPVGNNYCFLFVPPAGVTFVRYNVVSGYGATYKNDICINISDPSKNGTYEPYTSSTLSLPISTYFPTGMKSAGTVYDELTPTKGITRIGAVDLGSLTWVNDSSNNRFFTDGLTETIKKGSSGWLTNLLCANYTTANGISIDADKVISEFASLGRIYIKDTAYTDATSFKTAMSGVYLYYELSTPTETSFTTASFVTENAEIPLSNEDGVLVGKCTEQLSENPGFIDAKIKLSDSDGECYSNKLQLHVERSPQ